MLYFLSSISMFIFSFGGGNRLTKGTWSYSILTTQWFHVRVSFMSWDNASWRCAMFGMFALCGYQTKIKHIPSDDKCKPSSCVFTCNTTSVHLKRQYCLLFSNIFCIYPANICWSSRRLQDMSWRRLQHVFSVTIFRLPRRLENTLQIHLEDVLNTSWKTNKMLTGYMYLTMDYQQI